MQNCVHCKKQMILRIVLTVLNIRPAQIARDLNFSKSFVSKYLAGERTSIDIDTYLIEKIFYISVKDFNSNV